MGSIIDRVQQMNGFTGYSRVLTLDHGVRLEVDIRRVPVIDTTFVSLRRVATYTDQYEGDSTLVHERLKFQVHDGVVALSPRQPKKVSSDYREGYRTGRTNEPFDIDDPELFERFGSDFHAVLPNIIADLRTRASSVTGSASIRSALASLSQALRNPQSMIDSYRSGKSQDPPHRGPALSPLGRYLASDHDDPAES